MNELMSIAAFRLKRFVYLIYLMNSSTYYPLSKTGLLSSIFANFSAFIFCKEFSDLYGFSPSRLLSGGNCLVQTKISGKNFNILPPDYYR